MNVIETPGQGDGSWVKAFLDKPDDLRSIPGTHRVGNSYNLPSDSHICIVIYEYPYTHTSVHIHVTNLF